MKNSSYSKSRTAHNSKSAPIIMQNAYRDSKWTITKHSSIKITAPILIEGMPGIGNVGKISMDMLIEETRAKLWMSFFSHDLPNSVFVNEHNLVDLPKISIYSKRIRNQDYLFLTGDVQPITESSSYEFCEMIIQLFKDQGGKHILTLGGIGLAEIPESPKVYLTGNDKNFIDKTFTQMHKKGIFIERNIYGIVGPILGVSGLLLGLAKRQGISAYSLLAETFGHPVYIGLKGAKSILSAINKQYSFNLSLIKLDKEIANIDQQSKGASVFNKGSGKDKVLKYKKYSDVNYIG